MSTPASASTAASNRFVHPRTGVRGSLLNWMANSRRIAAVRRAILSRLPFLKLESDVVDVVYLNWVVPTEAALGVAPRGVRLVDRGGMTILTALTYLHGHFGPSALGPLRQAFPSPLQSNWRLYVTELPNGTPAQRTVLFLKNVFNSAAYSVGSRVFSDALPSHVAHTFHHERRPAGYTTRIEGGCGSAPEIFCATDVADAKALPTEFGPFFGSWNEAIVQLCEQDAAICAVDGTHRLARAGIELPIDATAIVPLTATDYVAGSYLRSLGATTTPFCFAMPRVKFKVLGERLL